MRAPTLDTFTRKVRSSRQECRLEGQSWRSQVPRSAHAAWHPAAKRADPLEVLRRTSEGCLPELLPIRYGRMVASPFAFFRGTAAIMAADLVHTPVSGAAVQASGDAHLMNFGAFATAERNLVFDLNDFDETLPGPWEWDVKRLAASVVLAGRSSRLSDQDACFAARAAVRAYRLRMREYAGMTHLEVWYDRIDASEALQDIADDVRQHTSAMFDKARSRTSLHALDKLAERGPDGTWRLEEDPPVLTHRADEDLAQWVEEVHTGYFDSVPEDRHVLLSRYRLADYALRVTGVGSAGRRCLVLLLVADDDDVLFLQVKEARASALEAHVGPCLARNPAHRIVRGQRLMQSAGDPFLGWATRGDHAFYVRQLRDMKGSFDLDNVSARGLEEYAELCGWVLARAHARTGEAAAIGGYLGKAGKFERAVATFARIYADQAEQDHAVLERAVTSGAIQAETGV